MIITLLQEMWQCVFQRMVHSENHLSPFLWVRWFSYAVIYLVKVPKLLVELSYTICSCECIKVIYILYVNLVKLSFDPLTIFM